ncbi:MULTISPECIES: ActS/PrrB/RegB family redox-sensitive histidine kinase [unclassified Roseitalea]|uniref:ActS/PrrB/RegB family redox-sensitive histidine kinase n=1 Tax=unclassified Roseitalea TaxID=2639107 RepID=UPI00273F968F|nr:MULTISPECIES: ActS/PrrB/RegB family redox-sensitive histidine kinase [unclassified Roseitalea]
MDQQVVQQEVGQSERFERRRLRMSTLINTRWIAVFGQSAAVTFVAAWFGFQFPVVACFALIAISAALNLVLTWIYPANRRLDPMSVFGVLAFDIMQLAALLFLTGGLENPFSVLLIVPVIISAATLPALYTATLGFLVVTAATVLVFSHLPLPWYSDVALDIPFIFVAGMWGAVISSVAFTAFYVYRVADEARSLADALSATELVLQREQHLSALDGLAAAAAHELGTPLATISLVSKEMDRATTEDDPLKEDVRLLRAQADRCRQILSQLSTLNTTSEALMSRLSLREMIEEVVDPHREFGVDIATTHEGDGSAEPVMRRNPGILYGLGNLVENAVDFARNRVSIRLGWSQERVEIDIVDDGPGFPSDQLEKLGEPDISMARGALRSRKGGPGLGLGIFIAKTLLERSGATLHFSNGPQPGTGAKISVHWPRSSIEAEAA